MDNIKFSPSELCPRQPIVTLIPTEQEHEQNLVGDESIVIDCVKLANLALAMWRAHRRSVRNSATPEAVLLGCETAIERLSDIGVELDDMIGQPYSENLRVQVVDRAEGSDLRIIDCLSPAVYINGQLTHLAEVVIGS